MPIYLAVPLVSESSRLDSAVEANIGVSDRYKLQADRGWLVRYEGTTRELSDKIGLTGQAKGEQSPVGSGLIVSVTTYYGRGPTEMWEWLRIRLEQ